MPTFDMSTLQKQQSQVDPAQQVKTFADRLKERRTNLAQQGQVAGQVLDAFRSDGGGVAVNPDELAGNVSSYSKLGRAVIAPSEQNLLNATKLYQDQQNKAVQDQQFQDELDLKKRSQDLEEKKAGYEYDIANKKLKGGEGTLGGPQALAEVIKQGGADFVKGLNKEAQVAVAQQILQTGGVKEYRKQLPLETLLTDKEKLAVGEQTDLLSKIEQAIPLFAKDKLGGTGPLAQIIPGIIAGKNTREMRRQVSDIRAQYQKAISGSTVSDAEVKRLEAFLPTPGKTESQNLEDLQKLQRGIQINQELFAIAKQEGLTPKQAYDKYRDEVFQKYGEQPLNTGNPTPSPSAPVNVGGYTVEVE